MKLIAETAWHHDGDFGFMVDFVDRLVKESKAHIVKLHLTLDRDEYMANDHPAYKLSKQKQFSEKEWEKIIKQIIDSEKELMLLFNDTRAIEFGMKFNPSLVEIHSVCLNDIHLLSKLREQNRNSVPVVLGVGGSTLYEIENAISFIDISNVILMHGFQNYPTKYEEINFNKIRKIMQLYPNYKHGYADHTAWNEPNNMLISTMGAALGMDFVEKHVTPVPGEERTDWQAAVSFDELNRLADNLKLVDICNGNGELKLNKGERAYCVFGPNKKAGFLKARKNIGDLLQAEDVMFKRTAKTSTITQLDVIDLIGKKAKCDLEQNSMITTDSWG
jgi:N,N'-diacetyllegionaminate synthase